MRVAVSGWGLKKVLFHQFPVVKLQNIHIAIRLPLFPLPMLLAVHKRTNPHSAIRPPKFPQPMLLAVHKRTNPYSAIR